MNLAALLWGFAEATLFFVVPDVLLSWIALHRARAAWIACVWALVGALAGGAVMYAWGAADAATAIAVLDHVPKVSREMCDAVREQLRNHGLGAVFLGPLTGTPYKIYAVGAGAGQIGLALFLAVSVPARLIRFALVTGLTVMVCRLFRRVTLLGRRAVHIVLWTAFYVWYFGA